MVATNNVGGSIPGSKSMFILQTINNCSASGWRYNHAPRNWPIHMRVQQCRYTLLKYCPDGNSTENGWSSTTETLGQYTMISPLHSYFHCREVVPQSLRSQVSLWDVFIREESTCRILVDWQESKAIHVCAKLWVYLHLLFNSEQRSG
jgi:hypothetical protein